MELSWLEDFLALAEAGHFSRAAERRNLTQPAFSRRIKSLEQWVGTDLFDRTAQPIALTEAGRTFHAAAEESVRRLSLGREEARAAASHAGQTLTFAATFSLSLTFFPGWLRLIEDRLPLGPTRLVSDTRDVCEEMLSQGRAHFLLCHVHPDDGLSPGKFRSAKVGEDLLVPVAASSSLTLPGSAEAPLPYLAFSEGSGMGHAVAALLARRPTNLQVAFVSHLASVLRNIARDGRGLAWLPESLIAEDLASGRLVRTGGPEWQVPLEIRLYRPKARMGKAAENLWAAATEY